MRFPDSAMWRRSGLRSLHGEARVMPLLFVGGYKTDIGVVAGRMLYDHLFAHLCRQKGGTRCSRSSAKEAWGSCIVLWIL